MVFFTKAFGNLRSFKYSERLQYLYLDSLQCRRVKADLIMCYKRSVTCYMLHVTCHMAWSILSLHVF